LEFTIQFACHLVIFVCVACILDSPRVSPGILEAEKLRRRPTRSTQEYAQAEKMQISSPLRLRIESAPGMATNRLEQSIFLFFLGHARFLFESRKFFL